MQLRSLQVSYGRRCPQTGHRRTLFSLAEHILGSIVDQLSSEQLPFTCCKTLRVNSDKLSWSLVFNTDSPLLVMPV